MAKTVLQQYREFHDLYARAHPQLSKSQAHDEANLKWNSFKTGGKVDQEALKVEVNALNAKLRKRKLTMFDFANNRKMPRVVSPSSPSTSRPPDPSPSTSAAPVVGTILLRPLHQQQKLKKGKQRRRL